MEREVNLNINMEAMIGEFIFQFVKINNLSQIPFLKKKNHWKTKFEKKSPKIATIACNMIHLFY
jgi:hypothetical protein